jgi:type II secretory pathway pseudopilin PulG
VTALRARLTSPLDPAGYALIELITVMLMLGIVLGALTTVYVSGLNAEVRLNRRFQAQSNARLALEKVRRDVHCASAITPTGTSGSVTLTLPASCTAGSGAVTWCTQGSGQRWGLYRVSGSSCTGGTQYADYITAQNVFRFDMSVAGTSLAKLHVDFPVNIVPSTGNTYRLADDIVLHNSTR